MPAQPRPPYFTPPQPGVVPGTPINSPILPQANVAGQSPKMPLSESPALTPPAAQMARSTSKPGLSRKSMLTIVAIIITVLLIAGIGVGLYLTQQSQDVRQQAATPTGTARLIISPGGPELAGGEQHNLVLTLDSSTTPINIRTIQLSITLSGNVPEDIIFQPENLTSISPANVEVISTSTGKTITVTFSKTGNEFQLSTKTLKLGEITFTAPQTGSLILRFSGADSQVIIGPNNQDILRPPAAITYTFASTNIDLPPTDSSATLSATATISATPTASISGSVTPTRTPTPVATDSGRLSSSPTSSQDQPVSGSISFTLFLISSGLICLGTGWYLFKQA